MSRFVLFIFATVGAAACHRGIQLARSIPVAQGDVRTLYALQYTDVELGTGGAAEAEKCLYAHYTGWLVDGKKFDSSRDTTTSGQPRTPLVSSGSSSGHFGLGLWL